MKMKVMKTTKKRKALQIYDSKKMMMTTVVLVLVEVVLVVVLLVEVLAKKCQFEVEIVARAEVVVLVLEGNSWKQGDICLITVFFLSNGYLNMPSLFGDLFCFLFCFFDELYITLQFDDKKRENR